MRKPLKWGLLGGAGLYLALGAFAVLHTLTRHEDLHSPPAASRDVYGFKSGTLGLLRPDSRKTEQAWPPAEPFPPAERFEGRNESFALQWEPQSGMGAGSPAERWVDELQDDDALEFVAFAAWIPQPDEPVDPERDWEIPLTFRDPETGRPLGAKRLEQLGIPGELASLDPPHSYHTPRLSLLFRTSGFEHVRFPECTIGDARTGARVSYDLESLGEAESRSRTIGEWTRLDAALLTWLDSPLDCRLHVLTGPSETARLETEPGAQVAFGERLRVQWLAEVERDFRTSSYLHGFKPAPSVPSEVAAKLRNRFNATRDDAVMVELNDRDEDEEPHPGHMLLRASSSSLLENHCARLGPTGPSWEWDSEEQSQSLYLASSENPENAPSSDAMELLFIPHIAELTFRIERLPHLPNGRDIEDLFDSRLPRITLPEDLSDAERQLLGFIGVGAQVAWESDLVWDERPPRGLPGDRTFRDTTPQALLNWYIDHTPGAFVRHDPDGMILHFNETEPSWWDQLIQNLGGGFP